MAMSNIWDLIKCVYSTSLLLFSMLLVLGLILGSGGDDTTTTTTAIARDIHPIFAILLMISVLWWLNMVEGGQASLVGLPPVHKSFYHESHPMTAMCTELAHQGDNLDRYLVGRQFLVLAIVFVTNLCGAPLLSSESTTLDGDDASSSSSLYVFGIPSSILDLFLRSGIAMILITTMTGQLNSQVNASHCMLDYINNFLAIFTIWVALGIECSGILHCVYLVQYIFAYVSGNPIQSKEEPRTTVQSIFFTGRVILSLVLLCIAFAVTVTALFEGKTTMWHSIPNGLGIIFFFISLSIVGLLEGMQIAFFAVAKLPQSDQGDHHSVARQTCQLLFVDNSGHNLPRFMVGRQIAVTMCFFLIARVTTLDVPVGRNDNLWNVSDMTQRFFNTGLLGALITTIVGSITWQLVASSFPMAFLSNPLVYIFLRICLLLEATGICSGAWVLAWIHKRLAHFQRDEVYIGTPEERLAKEQGDGPNPYLHFGTNVLTLPPGSGDAMPEEWARKFAAAQSFSERRRVILGNIKVLRDQLNKATASNTTTPTRGATTNSTMGVVVDDDDDGSPPLSSVPTPITVRERMIFEHALELELLALQKLNDDEQDYELRHPRNNNNTSRSLILPNGDGGDATGVGVGAAKQQVQNRQQDTTMAELSRQTTLSDESC